MNTDWVNSFMRFLVYPSSHRVIYLSSAFCLLSSVLCLLSSVFRLLSSVPSTSLRASFCLLFSVFRVPSSVFRPLSSVLCPLFPVLLYIYHTHPYLGVKQILDKIPVCVTRFSRRSLWLRAPVLGAWQSPRCPVHLRAGLCRERWRQM